MTKENKNIQKKSSKEVSKQKNAKRRWVTFLRMVRYGINNFSRNVWLTIAATAVMTITLLIIFSSMVLRNLLLDNVEILKENVSMSIYLKNEITDNQAEEILNQIRKLSSVKDVDFVSSSKAREEFIKQNSHDSNTLAALNEATNKFPATIHIKVKDINNTSELEDFTNNNEKLKTYLDENRKPSFAGSRKTAIQNIGNIVRFAESGGAVGSTVFILIASLIIFNTIQMAIYTRKEEIEMMKLIGADKSFVRGPFVVEAMVYGFIAALLATSLGYGLLIYFNDTLNNYISTQNTISLLNSNIGLVAIAMIFIGLFIGSISALLATRRHLKL